MYSTILQIVIISLLSCGATELFKKYITGFTTPVLYAFNYFLCLLLEVILNVALLGGLIFDLSAIMQIILYAFIELIISNLIYDKIKDMVNKTKKKDEEITNNEVQVGKVRYSKVIIVFMLVFTFIFTLLVLLLIYLKGTESQMVVQMYQNYLHLVEIELGILGGMQITDKIINRPEIAPIEH